MQGMIFTADQVAQQLREANRDYTGRRIWDDAYASVEMNKTASLNQLDKQFSSEMTSALLSSQQQKNAIYGSNLGQGYRELALEQNEQVLNDAFENYKINYLAGTSDIVNKAATATSEIDALLNSQAKNMADYGNEHYKYLSWLKEKNPDLFVNNANFAKYMNGDELISTEELTSNFFDVDVNTGIGTLNQRGMDFFKQIENAGLSAGAGLSFGDYLLSTSRGKELYDWAVATDPYGTGGTSADTFRKMTGSQGQYTPVASSFTDEEWSKVSKVYSDQIDSWNYRLEQDGDDEDVMLTVSDEMFDKTGEDGTVTAGRLTQLENTITQLGLQDEVGEAIGGWDNFNKRMNEYRLKIAGEADDGIVRGENAKRKLTEEALKEYQKLYDAFAKLMGRNGIKNKDKKVKYSTANLDGSDYDDYVAVDGTVFKNTDSNTGKVFDMFISGGQKVQPFLDKSREFFHNAVTYRPQ